MMLLALSREGMAGVWGVCGEIGFPGDDAVDTEVPAIMAGTLERWRLEDEDDRCSIVDEVTESESAVCESLMRWYLFSWAVVLRMVASLAAWSLRLKLFSSFLDSSNFKKSEMFSSSVLTSPELASSPSPSVPEPRCTEEVALPFPLLRLSSSVLLPPPEENLLLRCPKLLLYRLIGAGFGELDADEAMAASFGSDGVLSAAWGSALSDVRFLGWFSELGTIFLPKELPGLPKELLGLPVELLGDAGTAGPGAGDDDSEPALNGWNETDVRRWYDGVSAERREDFEPCAVRWLGGSFCGGDSVGDDEGMSRAARSADMGLVPVGGPTWWNVDRLP
jgi:hypothetical protein